MKFSIPKTFLLGFGFFAVSIIWSVYNAFVPLYLDEQFMLAPALIGFFMTLDNIAAFFIQPAVGAWSDQIKTRFGRRKPFIMIGAPLGALAFALIPVAGGAKILPFFVACTSSLLLSMALWRTPVIALMPDITPSKYRSQANGIINFMGGIGSIIAFFIGAKLYEQNPNFPFWLGSVLVLLGAALVVLFIKEPAEIETVKTEKPNLLKALTEIFQMEEKSPLRMLLAIFFWFVAYNAIEAFFTLYAVNHLGMPAADGARLLGLLSLCFVLMALPSGLLGGKIGRKKVIMTGIIGLGLCMLSMFFIPKDTLTYILVPKLPVIGTIPVIGAVVMLAGLSWGLININSLPMVVDMTDNEHLGTYTGLYYLASTMAAILGPNLNGWIIQLSGGDYSVTMLAAPIFMVGAFIMMLGVKRGDPSKEKPVS